jgi:signal peptidase I
VFGLALLALGLRLFVVEAYKIPSGSMWPSLEVQDHIFVSKFARIPDYGDVIVFDYPRDRTMAYVKRVVALGGDHVQFEGTQPVINGWKVPRCALGRLEYLQVGSPTPRHEGEAYVEFLGRYAYIVFEDSAYPSEALPFDVPAQQVFVVGDNRNNSFDSRNWNRGQPEGVPLSDIRGRSSVVWLAFYPDGQVDSRRVMHPLIDPPVLPQGASGDIRQKLGACLARRPAATRPPRPLR